jgi:hypothetical protein
MQEPAYILSNGKTVPYVPIEIKTARDAYAASLHVLFKHVADFHICIVRTFSSKYGIPEDEILKTIQESEEFKNMTVDPVLDTDQINTLGYLQPESSQQVPVEELQQEAVPVAAKKKPVASKAKKAKPVETVETPSAAPAPAPPAPVVEEERREPEPIKPKTIKKKVIQKPAPVAPPAPVNLFDMNEASKNVIAANTSGTLQAQVLETPPVIAEAPDTIKTKTIKKKVIQKPVPAAVVEPVLAPPIVAIAEGEPRKIIKKKVNATA